jgi:cellulose biosynthesis protein BcsQ
MIPTAFMAVMLPDGTFHAEMDAPQASSTRVLVLSSNKGGVGKTTVATNLAVYVRALRESLPVLVISLDDQQVVDRMFALRRPEPGEGNLKHGWAERSFARLIQLGQYGVHFVPSAPDVTLLKARAEDPRTLWGILDRSEWPGLVILDTKADLEALTRSAYHAADRVLIPVSDRASLEEAGKSFALLEREGLGRERGRVLLTLVDRRTRLRGESGAMLGRLLAEIRRRGWPCCETYLSRSPTVEGLNSGGGRPLSILHHAQGTAAHSQMRALTEELLQDLRLARIDAAPEPAVLWGPQRGETPLRPALESLASGILGALGRRQPRDRSRRESG